VPGERRRADTVGFGQLRERVFDGEQVQTRRILLKK
jgi:hypothetical protein